jgi:hAT family C-terminal dimerisation region
MNANVARAQLDLEEVAAPRKRRPPKRFTGPAEAFSPDSAFQYYKLEYFKVIDTALTQLTDRLNQDGLAVYEKLEKCLLTGEINDAFMQYPEIDTPVLQIQLKMFRMQFKYNSTDEAASAMQSCVPEVRRMLNYVETLIRLLLVVPATSCEAERSFSGLRRLKTWLRSTMTQRRLNSVAVCNVHKNYLDKIDLLNVANNFVDVHGKRLQLFGKY